MTLADMTDAIATDRRLSRRLTLAVLLSLLFHGVLLSLEFGLPGTGLPGLELPWSERRAEPLPLSVRIENIASPPAEIFAPLPPLSPPPAVTQPASDATDLRMVSPPPAPVIKPTPPRPSPPRSRAAKRKRPSVIAQKEARVETFEVAKADENAKDELDTPEPPQEEPRLEAPVPFIAEPIEQQRLEEAERQAKLEREAEIEKVLEEARRQEALAQQKELEEEMRQRTADAEATRQAELERQLAEKKLEAEKQAQQEKEAQERLASEQEAKRIQEENARKLAAEEEVQKQREERQRQQAALQRKEEERQREQEAEARRVREFELQQAEVQRQEELRKQEALARQRAQELEERRRYEEALAKQRELEERRREEEALAQARAKELEARRKAEEEARKLAEALAHQKEGEELAARLREEEAARKRAAAEAATQREIDGLLGSGSPASTTGVGRSGDMSNLPKTGGSLAARALEQIRQPGAAKIDQAETLPSGDMPGSSRRGTVFGSIDTEVGLRAYVEGWRHKIERGGNLNYAQSSKDRARGDPVVSVSIRSDGSVENVVISRSSGRPELDEAVRRIVKLHAPYAAFSPTLARRYDVIVIRRIWSFDDRLRILEEMR